MDRLADDKIADMAGSEALPRRSGELVFHDEWERRVFAMAVALCEQGSYDWEEFREQLKTAIDASGESAENPDPNAPGYFEHWLASFERLLANKGIVQPGTLPPNARPRRESEP